MRALVDMNVSYKHNADDAIRIAQEVCQNLAADENIVEGPNVEGIEMIEDHKMVLRVSAQTKNMMQWGIQRDIWKALKEAFDENCIMMSNDHQFNLVENERAQ